MSVVATLARCLVGYAAACSLAGAVQVAFVLPPTDLLYAGSEVLAAAGLWTMLAAVHTGVFAAPLAALAIAIGEQRRIRRAGYYAALGIGIAALGFLAQLVGVGFGQPLTVMGYPLAAFGASGLAGGLLYWLIAGRTAGTARLRE
jgi:hypothetical protein